MKTLIAALLALILAPLARATGVTPYSLGASTGTALVVISNTPASFWGIAVSSASDNDHYKCWNASSTSGLTLASAPTLAGAQWKGGTPNSSGPQSVPTNASQGIVCAKDDASSECLIYAAAY